MNRGTLLLLASVMGLGACKEPLHLQYDFGRAYIETLRLQADLTRPSVANASYHLYGREGVTIRINVQEKATEETSSNFEIAR
jgi:hypothetical protein